MRISARNQIKGTVVEVRKGATTSHVRVDIGNGQIVTPRSPTRRSMNWASRPKTK
jgi:molybdopterin-binding protein